MNIDDRMVSDILERAMVARIATVSKNGRPHVNPLYFVAQEGHIVLGTATFTLAAHNVGANASVQILFEIESAADDPRILRMTGTAVVRTDLSLLRMYRRRVTRKYIATPRGLRNLLMHPHQWRPLRRHVSGGSACVLDVSPTSVELLIRGVDRPGSGDVG